LNVNELWQELIRLLSVDGQPTKAVLAQTYMGVFLIRSLTDTIFLSAFSSEIAADHLAKQPWTTSGPQTTV
jgi:hypothetical protein